MARTQPKRKMSPAVYRRRRIAALIVLVLFIALLWGLFNLVRGWLSSDGDSEANPGPTTSATTPTIEPSPTATGPKPRACEASEIAVSAAPASDTVKIGGDLDIAVTWENIGEAACLVDGGFGETTISITSGSDEIWTSSHCTSESIELFLDAGEDYSRTYNWKLERAGAECEGRQAVTRGGTYRVKAEVLGAASEEAVFVIEE